MPHVVEDEIETDICGALLKGPKLEKLKSLQTNLMMNLKDIVDVTV